MTHLIIINIFVNMKITENMIFFITGGASGLGEQTVKLIHSKGAKVAIADWNEENLDKIKTELKERVLTFVCNVTNEQDVKNAMYGTAEQWGTIHVALACAGVAWPMLTYSPKKELDIETFKKVVDINLYGSIYVAKYGAVIMAKNTPVNERGEKGLILFVSSVAAEEGQKGQVAYSATKGALNGMTLPMARDLGRYGIRVAAIAPGIFETPLSGMMP